MTRTQKILIIEDDPNTSELLSLYLTREGFECTAAADGQAGLQAAEDLHPDLVVLDLMLPHVDGWEVCRRLRRAGTVPILMLTARGQEKDRVRGFAEGADDYVVKPFSPSEVAGRIKAILRRTSALPPGGETLQHGDLTLDREKRIVLLSGRPVDVTPSEYTLLETLMQRPGRVFSREELVARLYPSGESVVSRVVDVHMGELRRKIEQDRGEPRHVLTVRGFGYKFATGGADDSVPQ